MMTYNKFDIAGVGETIGWKSAAGYLEGEIIVIHRKEKTACPNTLTDCVLVKFDPYFARYEGETHYTNANFLMRGGKVRVVESVRYAEAV